MREKLIHASGAVAFTAFLCGGASLDCTPVRGAVLMAIAGAYFALYAYQNGGI